MHVIGQHKCTVSPQKSQNPSPHTYGTRYMYMYMYHQLLIVDN